MDSAIETLCIVICVILFYNFDDNEQDLYDKIMEGSVFCEQE